MAARGFRIMDADGHVMEPAGMWQRYIAAEFRDRAPRVGRGADGRTRILVDGVACPRDEGRNRISPAMREVFALRIRELLARAASAEYNAESQIAAMDEGGVDVAFLYPTQGLYTASVDELDPALAIATCRAYNDWILTFCSHAPERLMPVAMLVALHDPDLALAEAERVAGAGFKGVFIRPNPVRGRRLDDPAYEPLWALCERRGLAIGVHEGQGALLPAAGADRFTTFFESHTASHPIEQMLAMLSLIAGGVLERHPGLRVAFLESGCGWLPYWLWRMDEHWEQCDGVPGEPRLVMKPSDYFRRQCWISCEPDEPYVAEILDRIGEDRLLFASDYPHPDHKWPETVEAILAMPIHDAAKKKILWDNPRALYGLERG